MAITADAVEVVLPYYPPVLVCIWHMIRPSSISRPPERSIAFSPIHTNPLHTRSTSYLQYYELIQYRTPYSLAVICRFYGPSSLRLLPVLRACAEPQAGVSPPRRSPLVLSEIISIRTYKVPLREVHRGVAQEQNQSIQHLTAYGQIRCTWWQRKLCSCPQLEWSVGKRPPGDGSLSPRRGGET